MIDEFGYLSAADREASLQAQREADARQEQLQRDEDLSRQLLHQEEQEISAADAKSVKAAKTIAQRELSREGLRVNVEHAQKRIYETVTAEASRSSENDRRRLQYRRDDIPITGVHIRGTRKGYSRTVVQFQIIRFSVYCFQNLDGLSKYGYTELLEIRKAGMKSKSMFKEEFLNEVNRLLQRIAVSAHIQVPPSHQRSSQRRPRRRRDYINPSIPSAPSASYDPHFLDHLKLPEDYSMLNVAKPEGVSNLDDGDVITEPEAGMGFMDELGLIKFFRNSEIPIAPTDFLKAIINRCRAFRLNAEGQVKLYLAELNRRPVDV